MEYLTVAAQFASEMVGGTTVWTSAQGVGFTNLLVEFFAKPELKRDNYYCCRYEFEDGSAVVAVEGSWHVEGPEPFSCIVI